jgi:hypothetical protein
MIHELEEPNGKESWYKDFEACGVPISRNAYGFDPIVNGNPFNWSPIVSITIESDEPTRDEVDQIGAMAGHLVEKFSFHPTDVKGMFAKGFNTITFKKNFDGTWTFRRMSWTQGPTWFPIPGTLEELKEKL